MAKKKSEKPKPKQAPAAKRPSARKAEPRATPIKHEIAPDARAMEAMMWGRFGPKAGDTSLAAAQELIYEAFEQSDPKKRAKLAKAALDLSADCADAYVLLAEQTKGRAEKLDLYRQGVAAGERALGPDLFRDGVGHFWGLLETRPYMRARFGLAATLWSEGEHEEAADHLRDMLRLNPNDNQGLRYTLAGWLIKLDRDEELARLLNQYDEVSATWNFTKALLAFRLGGDTPASVKLLKEADRTNSYVREYLTGAIPLPLESPGAYSSGEPSEAIIYAQEHLGVWRSTPGAITWLATVIKPKPPKAPPQKAVKATSMDQLIKVHQQSDEWQVDFLSLPTMIDGGDGPARPAIILVANRTRGTVLNQEVAIGVPTPEDIWAVVVKAIRKPSHGKPHRPSRVEIPANSIWDGVQAHFEQIGVACERSDKLDMITDVFGDMLEHLGISEEPGMLETLEVSPERIRAFFEAAADFYDAALWKSAPSDRPIMVKSDSFTDRPWYAVVMGQMGVSLGVAFYHDLRLLKRLISGELGEEENVAMTEAMSLIYDKVQMANPTDLAATSEHGWTVANPEAFPSVIYKERGMNCRPVTTDELSLIEASIRVLPNFVASVKPGNPAETSVVVTVEGRPVHLKLSWVEV